MSPEHTIELNKSINLIRHPPVLNYDNELKPMNKIPMSNLSWGKWIGFVVGSSELLPVKQQDFCEAKLFQEYSFVTEDGGELPIYHPPSHGFRCKEVSPDTPLPYFQLLILMKHQCVAVHH